MEISFCDKCDNMHYIYLNPDTNELYNVCKSCGNSELKENESKQIYSSNTDGKSSISEIINLNPYISHDITLPVIKNNSNITANNKPGNKSPRFKLSSILPARLKNIFPT